MMMGSKNIITLRWPECGVGRRMTETERGCLNCVANNGVQSNALSSPQSHPHTCTMHITIFTGVKNKIRYGR